MDTLQALAVVNNLGEKELVDAPNVTGDIAVEVAGFAAGTDRNLPIVFTPILETIKRCAAARSE